MSYACNRHARMYINIISIPSKKYVNRGLFCARIFAFEKKQ